MALQGELKIGGRTYGVVECAYEFNQSIDDTGKPVTRPKGGQITFVMPATSDDDLFFYKWIQQITYNVILSILSFRIPEGTCASTVSPIFLPNKASAIGDFIEIFPSFRLAS